DEKSRSTILRHRNDHQVPEPGKPEERGNELTAHCLTKVKNRDRDRSENLVFYVLQGLGCTKPLVGQRKNGSKQLQKPRGWLGKSPNNKPKPLPDSFKAKLRF